MTTNTDGAMPELPAMPSNIGHVMRRIRACESEAPAQLVLEHALREYARAAIQQAAGAVPEGYAQRVIDALYENGDPVSVDAAELLTQMLASQAPPKQQPVNLGGGEGGGVPLTKDEKHVLCSKFSNRGWSLFEFIEAIEAAHGIKEAS